MLPFDDDWLDAILNFLETLPVSEHESEHMQQAGMVLYAGRIDILALP